MFGFVRALFKFIEVFGKLAIVLAIGVAGALYSPICRGVFIGIVLGALGLFGLEYNHIFEKTTQNYCINPNTVPGGPKKQCFIASDPTDPREMYGHWEACE